VSIWILAADKDGEVPNDARLIAKLCYMDEEPDLQVLVAQGFLESDVNMTSSGRQSDVNVTSSWRQDDVNVTSSCGGVDRLEKNREEENREEKKRNAHAREHVSDHFPEVPAEDLGPFKSEVSEPVPEELFSLMRSGETVYDVEKAWHLIVDAGIDPAAVVRARKDHCKERERTYWSGLAKWLKKTAAGGLPPESKKKTFNHRPDWVRALGKGGARTY
jgi:hypothetical protein